MVVGTEDSLLPQAGIADWQEARMQQHSRHRSARNDDISKRRIDADADRLMPAASSPPIDALLTIGRY